MATLVTVARPRALSCATRARGSCIVSSLVASSRSVCSMVEQGDGGGRKAFVAAIHTTPPLKPGTMLDPKAMVHGYTDVNL